MALNLAAIGTHDNRTLLGENLLDFSFLQVSPPFLQMFATVSSVVFLAVSFGVRAFDMPAFFIAVISFHLRLP